MQLFYGCSLALCVVILSVVSSVVCHRCIKSFQHCTVKCVEEDEDNGLIIHNHMTLATKSHLIGEKLRETDIKIFSHPFVITSSNKEILPHPHS